jgi:prepilin-type processing-associated H-X9-DG protein
VELLVVIGIIAVMISILLPALRRAREQAVTVECLSNLRQVGILMLQYANEDQGAVPEGFPQGELAGGSWGQDPWYDFYTSAEYAPLLPSGMLRCPYTQAGTYGVPWNPDCTPFSSYKGAGEFATFAYGTPYGNNSYVFAGVKLIDLQDCTDFVLAMDTLTTGNTTSSPLINITGGFYFVTCQSWSGGQITAAWLAHPVNTANTVFADGHAETCDEGRLRTVNNYNLYTSNNQGITAYWDSNGKLVQ